MNISILVCEKATHSSVCGFVAEFLAGFLTAFVTGYQCRNA